jgi:hypothetical protein
MSRPIRAARIVASVLLAATAVNHARLAATGQGVVWRHGLFSGIDLAAAVLLVVAPRRALAPVAILAVQQTYSHGRDLLASLGGPSIDWPSLAVILFFPALVTLLVVERRADTSGSPPRGRPRS